MRVLTARHLNQALLARQLLLERAEIPLEDAVDRVGGLQVQYAPSGYVGAIVVDPFERLSAADRDAVEAERAALEAFHA